MRMRRTSGATLIIVVVWILGISVLAAALAQRVRARVVMDLGLETPCWLLLWKGETGVWKVFLAQPVAVSTEAKAT